MTIKKATLFALIEVATVPPSIYCDGLNFLNLMSISFKNEEMIFKNNFPHGFLLLRPCLYLMNNLCFILGQAIARNGSVLALPDLLVLNNRFIP